MSSGGVMTRSSQHCGTPRLFYCDVLMLPQARKVMCELLEARHGPPATALATEREVPSTGGTHISHLPGTVSK